MTKYGTFVMFQNKTTDEVIEVALADEESLSKYGSDNDWREVAGTEDIGDDDSKEENKEL